MPKNVPRPEDETPAAWQGDLNPDLMAGRNEGLRGPQPAKSDTALTAYDLKEVHRQLPELTDDDLKQIPILPRGSRLEQGATYIDLRDAGRAEFAATSDMEAGGDNWYVPKSEVDYQVWNRLIGVTNQERLGEADES